MNRREHIRIMMMEGWATMHGIYASAADGFWSVVIGAVAEESVKQGQVMEVATLLKEQGIQV